MRRRFMIQNDTSFVPLTIEALEDGLQVSFTQSLLYRIDDGEWNELQANHTTPTINVGQTISLKGGVVASATFGIGTFSINKKCNLKGNCMSLIFGDKANSKRDLSGYTNVFNRLFDGCDTIINISKEFLPSTKLAESCYAWMFSGCTSLTTAPELPATTLEGYCYYGMFYGCTNLNYIKMLATDISASSCLYDWVYKVSSTGTFVKNKDATWDVTGSSGVPTGWTVIDDTFPTNEDGFPESTEFSFPLYLNIPKEPVYEDEYGAEYELEGDAVSGLCDWIKNLTGDYYYFDTSKAIFINRMPVSSIIKRTGNAEVRGIDGFTELGLDFSMNMLYGYKEKL